MLENITYEDNDSPPLPMVSSFGVTVEKYGKIVNGPHRLLGAEPQATYSSLQYLLHTKKIVNFPIPTYLKDKLIIDISTRTDSEKNIPDANGLVINFMTQDKDGKLEKRINIFENLYLFNWYTGESFHLSSELKDLIQKIRINQKRFFINDYIVLAQKLEDSSVCEIIIDKKHFSDIKIHNVHPKVFLYLNEEKKGHIDFHLEFFDDDEHIIPTPQFLNTFTFTGGLLSSFKRKKDAYDFIHSIKSSIEHENGEYKKLLVSSNQRNKLFDIITNTLKTKTTLTYNPKKETLNRFENELLVKILINLHDNFGELFFRYSSHQPENQSLRFQVTLNSVFGGLSKFHQILSPYGLNIFYNKEEIKRWNSRLRFERRQSFNEWFDLELKVTKEDLEIIQNANLDTGLALTSMGLIQLSNEQKDLLKFMQRYTKYEATKQTQEISDENSDDGENKEADDLLNTFLLPFHRTRIFELFELKKLGLEGALTEEEEKLCHQLATFTEMPTYEVPDQLKNILRPYQVTGHNWLNFLYENKLGACLADDMGLGKTLQTISFLKTIYHKINRVLIICPVTILLNWKNEIERFSDMDSYIYHGDSRSLPDDKKIILTSYGIMKKEVHNTFEQHNFDVIVLDEVQHLKNIRSQGAYAARQLKAGFRICLTGTPVENDLAEFYNIMDLCIPGIWGDLQFIKTTSTKKSRFVARKMASPFILRRSKSQVLSDLPPKIQNDVILERSEEEESRYQLKLKEIQQRILLSPSKKKYGEILKGLLELRQSCLWQKGTDSIRSTKIDFLFETLEQILEEGHQAIVFSQFTTYLNVIQQNVENKHWKYSRIDGSQTIKKRQKEVERFQAGETSVFLISLKAGGVGLNLTAASYVFVMDPWWNPAVESQAIDRAHRIGQKNTLNVYRPIIKNSVEEKVLKLQEIKKQLFYDLLPENDDNFFSGKLSKTDFEMLLS